MSSGGENDGKEADDVIRLIVDDVKKLDPLGRSEVKRIDGFPWKLRASHSSDGELRVQIGCEKSRECAVWECEVEAEVKLVNYVNAEDSLTETLSRRLNFEQDCMETSLISWENLIEDTDFVSGGKIVIEAKIVVKKRIGSYRFRTRSSIDFLSSSNYSDVVVVVEGQKLHVSKQILAHSSSYFKELFYVKKSQEKEIELKDVSAEQFVTVLELIYDSVNGINEENVEDVARIAKLFAIPKILNEVEKWLLIQTSVPSHKVLLIADRYNLPVAEVRMLNAIDTFEGVTGLMRTDSFKHYSADLRGKLMKKMEEIREKEKEGAAMDVG